MSVPKTTYHRSDDAAKYRSNASFVFNDENTREVLKLLEPQVGDVILDVGCGSGELTRVLHSIVCPGGVGERSNTCGSVYGIDTAEGMIEAATRSGEDSLPPGLSFEVCDGHQLVAWLEKHDMVGKFDKVFSNAALHWMKESPSTVIEGMSAALKPSGVLAIEMGGHMNCIGVRGNIRSALKRRKVDASQYDPWYFPTPESYGKKLLAAGLHPTVSYLYPRPTALPVGSGLLGWLETFAGPFVNALPTEAERIELLKEVEDQARIEMYDAETDQWTLMYVRLRVQAIKK